MAKLEQMLGQIRGPMGFSSLVHGLLSGDSSGLDREPPAGSTLETARARLAAVETAQANCGSDYVYWGYEGEAAAWRAAVSILEAAEITGADDLPDMPYTPRGGVLMDECYHLEEWGRSVLEKAKSRAPDGKG